MRLWDASALPALEADLTAAVPTFESARVRLRPMEGADAPGVFAMYSDEEVSRYLARPRLTEPGQAMEVIDRARKGYEDGTSLQLTLERRDDNAFLGVCLLFNFHAPSARGEIGYALGRPHWSRGYVREGLPALVDHAFRGMGLHRLEADIDPRNAASARVVQRLGFRPEGLLRERWVVGGERSDSAIYGLLRREWGGRSLIK